MAELVGLLALASLAVAVLAALLVRSFAVAALVLAAAATWILGPGVPDLLLVHRPLLLHALLRTRSGRRLDGPSLALLGAVWASALVVPVGRLPGVMLGLALLVAADAARRRPDAAEVRRQLPKPAVGMLTLALALGMPALLRLMGLPPTWQSLPALLYDALIASTGVALAGALLRQRWSRDTDLVLELADAAPREFAAALRQEASAQQVAGARASLLAAADLLDAHVRLTEELAARADEVRASRRRLLNTAVDERRRLACLLSDGAGRYLSDLDRTLEELEAQSGRAPVQQMVQACRAEMVRTREDIDQLARGLHPRLLVERGLRCALLDLAERSALPVDCCTPVARLAEPVEVALWYAVAEAVTNAGKHSGASRVAVEVRAEPGQVVATVADDGSGGALIEPGGGLAGVADRLDALGGRLEVSSPPGGGTVLRMTVPTC
jgi:signal transduction histidine kinase